MTPWTNIVRRTCCPCIAARYLLIFSRPSGGGRPIGNASSPLVILDVSIFVYHAARGVTPHPAARALPRLLCLVAGAYPLVSGNRSLVILVDRSYSVSDSARLYDSPPPVTMPICRSIVSASSSRFPGLVVVFCNDDRYTFQMRVALASIFLQLAVALARHRRLRHRLAGQLDRCARPVGSALCPTGHGHPREREPDTVSFASPRFARNLLSLAGAGDPRR